MGQRSVVSQRGASLRVGKTLGVPGGVLVLVTRAPVEDGLLRCGDEVLTEQPPPACSASAGETGAIRPGEWFTDPVSGVEVLCTREGSGVLTFNSRPVQRQPGPSSRSRAGADA